MSNINLPSPNTEKWGDFFKHKILPIDPFQVGIDPHPLPSKISSELPIDLYLKHMSKIHVLISLRQIEPKEAGRLISMLDSEDPENWTVAEECIKQKLSEL